MNISYKTQSFSWDSNFTLKSVLSLFIVLFAFQSTVYAKKKHTFENFKVQIKTNKHWQAETFGNEKKWDGGENDICSCAGILLRNTKKNLKFVIYPSSAEGVKEPYRQQVMQYDFAPVDSFETVKTKYFNFTKKTSGWQDFVATNSNQEIITYEAWQYVGEAKNGNFYTIYVFTEHPDEPSPAPFSKEIQKIIKSVKPLK